jgi:histidinol phosphatase-like enzyme
VLEKTISFSPQNININEAGLKPGFYLIIIENKSGIMTSRLLIM